MRRGAAGGTSAAGLWRAAGGGGAARIRGAAGGGSATGIWRAAGSGSAAGGTAVSKLDDELIDIFRDEAAERLDQMETALLAVESGDAVDAGAESVDSLFRNAHTIKGAAGMLGLDDIQAIAHAVEDVLAGVRDEVVFRPELAAPLLRATAALRAQVAGVGGPVAGLLDDLAASKATPADDKAGAAAPGAAAAPGTADAPEATAAPGVADAPEPGPSRLPGLSGLPEPRAPGVPESAAPAAPGPELPGGPEVTRPDQDAHAASPGVVKPKAERRPLRVPAEKIDR